MQRILYTRPDGGISVVVPCRSAHETLTDEETQQRAWDALPPDAGTPRWVREGEIPTDRTFRNAWRHDFTVDMDKARAITKDRLRVERAPLLAAQDIAFNRNLETGADNTAVIAEKQRLRDLPALVDAASTVKALMTITAR